MKKILSTLIAVAFLSVAAGALAAEPEKKGEVSPANAPASTTSQAELDKIHSAPAKKKAKKKAKAKPAGEAAPASSAPAK